MKKTSLLLILSLLSLIVFAGKIEKAYQALEVYNYFEAKKIFEKFLVKKRTPSSFGLSIIFLRDDNPFHNLDSAYKYICIADSSFTLIGEKERENIKEVKIDSLSIQALKDTIDKKVYEMIKNSVNILVLQNYIDKHLDSDYSEIIKNSRNKIIFEKVKNENTSVSYLQFLKEYPRAKQATEAKNRYEERFFIEQTKSGLVSDYKKFIHFHTNSPYLSEAEDSVYAIMTKDKKLKNYRDFLSENPFNANANKAWRQLYKLYMTDYSQARIIEFKIDYPNYPFIEELKVDIKLAAKRFLPFKKDSMWGFIDNKGVIMIAPQYQSVEEFSNGLALVVKNGKVGYIDKAGKTIIPFEYQDGESFKNGFAVIAKDDLYGMIDRTNTEVIPLEYELVSPSDNGMVLIANEEFYGYCNLKGELVIPLELNYASDFINGYAIVEIENKKGMINALGGLVIPAIYSWLEPFNKNGFCRAKKDTLYGVLDKNGAEVIPFIYHRIGRIHDNRALVEKRGKYSYVNIKEDREVELEFDYLAETQVWGEFYNGYTKFFLNGKFGIIDTNISKVFPAIFQDVGEYQDKGYTAVKKRGKWGYSDENLKLVIPYKYNYASTFFNEIAIAKTDSLFGLINKKGDWVLKPEYNEIKLEKAFGYILLKDENKGVIGLNLEPLLSVEYNNIKKVDNSNLLILYRNNEISYYDYSIKSKIVAK